MRFLAGERDRIYVRRGPPMAQTYRHDACADRPQTDGVRGNRRWDVKALKGGAGMRLRSGDWRVLFTIKGNTITIHAVGDRRGVDEGEETMAKTGILKSKVQFIPTPGGDDLAVLPRHEYDRLVILAAEAQEDASASRIVRSSMRALKEAREVVLPKAVADRLD